MNVAAVQASSLRPSLCEGDATSPSYDPAV